jgi:hypothetical protein
MDYGQACDTIANEDSAVHDALLDADGNEAARLWRVKIERCVRYMIAQLPEDDVAPYPWTTLAGRPRMRPESRGAGHTDAEDHGGPSPALDGVHRGPGEARGANRGV